METNFLCQIVCFLPSYIVFICYRDQIKQLAKLLMQIHAVDIAMTLANKYSLKVAQL